MLFLLFTLVKAEIYYQVALNPEKETSDQVCDRLNSMNLNTNYDVLQARLTQSLIDDCALSVESKEENLDEFENYYYATQLSLIDGNNQGCSQLGDFVGQAGAIRTNKKKRDEDNYRNSALFAHLVVLCKADQFSKVIQTALINIQEVYQGVYSIIDKENPIGYTAQFLHSFFELNITDLNPKVDQFLKTKIYQNTIINLVLANRQNKGSLFQQYWIKQLLEHPKVKDIVLGQISDVTVVKQAKQVQIRFTNLSGQKVDAPKNVKGFLNTKQGEEQIELTTTSKQKDLSYLNFEVPKLGYHQLRVEFENYELNFVFRVVEQVSIDDLSFGIVESKSQKPQFSQDVEDGQVYPITLKANERSFLHVIFKIKSSYHPQQVTLRLVHPQYNQVSTQVAAEFDQKRGIYYGIIDFGDPDHIHPTDGVYGVELLIGDYKIEAKRWRFLNVECKFQANTLPSDDSTYKLKEKIVHQFEQPTQDIPFLFVSFFIIVMLIAFVFYLNILQSLGLKNDKLPDGPDRLLVYIFSGLLIAVFLVLVLFWVKLNLIETVTVLAALFLPLVLVGNYALLTLKSDEKQKEKVE
ncbi:hypothetical protein pb186bvf_017139 [Paramecium bursaria]